MPELHFDKSTIPDLNGRVVLVTGGTAGIGAGVAIELAKHNPGRIRFTGRNERSAESTISSIKIAAPNVDVTFIPCDLASLASVKEAANKILAQCSRLDLFLANAGVMAIPAGLSPDGYENHWAINHMGHALLTKKLLPLLEKTADLPGADVRVIYTTSLGWRGGSIDTSRVHTTMESAIMGRWFRYGNSKLANMLYALELSRRHPKLLCFSVHPGVVSTGLVTDLKLSDRLFVQATNVRNIITPEQGTFNHLWAVSAPRTSIRQGAFYEPVGKCTLEELAVKNDKKYTRELWDYTEKELEKWMD